ncbi:MAG TPA: glycosyltransferase family 9 protein, partial [Opitutaceae bacterium]|nr:glycosyltransferase family 9 protein [Opitutaceae bacterium]
MQSSSRPALLVLELWGLGDLALAVPFLREAARHTDTTLVTKPQWAPLVETFCGNVALVPFVAPWTAFTGKYRLRSWPWRELFALRRTLRARRFDVGVSVRPDPRDHLLLLLAGARRRVGFPRAGSSLLLSTRLEDGRTLHRAEAWRRLAATQGWTVPASAGRLRPSAPGAPIVLHSGAARPTRLWPLDRYADLAGRLRRMGRTVRVHCDAGQLAAWRALGEAGATTPADPQALIDAVADAAAFVGNDSGPGHVAALCGVPTFTIFGPNLSARFSPVHPAAAWVDGHDCPYKPCRDYCRFPSPYCLDGITADEVWPKLEAWVGRP